MLRESRKGWKKWLLGPLKERPFLEHWGDHPSQFWNTGVKNNMGSGGAKQATWEWERQKNMRIHIGMPCRRWTTYWMKVHMVLMGGETSCKLQRSSLCACQLREADGTVTIDLLPWKYLWALEMHHGACPAEKELLACLGLSQLTWASSRHMQHWVCQAPKFQKNAPFQGRTWPIVMSNCFASSCELMATLSSKCISIVTSALSAGPRKVVHVACIAAPPP